MKPLGPASQVRAILSFDFDGTLHDPAEDPPVPTEFFEIIRRLRESRGVVWGINTGRSMAHTVDGMIESRFPFLPDYVVAREHHIFFPNDFGRWLPHGKWNDACDKEIHRLFKRSKNILKQIRREVAEHTGAQWIEMEGDPAGIVSRSVEEMAWIVPRVVALAASEPDLGWQRNSIYLRFGHRDYQKGSSLSEIARLHSLGPEKCFAIGDSHNDFEMLDPAHAGMAACPANAVAEIKATIAASGGYQCSAAHGHGAIEALRHYFGPV